MTRIVLSFIRALARGRLPDTTPGTQCPWPKPAT
jgi:hypothetical protein